MKLHLILTSILITTVVGCAAPATKSIDLSDAEIRREQQQQIAMAKKYPAKIITEPKHKDIAHYQKRLHKVAPSLAAAAKKICKSSNCNYSFKVSDEKVLNAWADGKSVNITPMMMDFLDTDKELAVVLSHELSHNIMQHINKQQQNIVVGSIIDIAAAVSGFQTLGLFGSIGSMSHSQGFENEADYVGIYIMALAGYDISNINHLWRKMSVQTPSDIHSSFFRSHPSNPERYLRMQKAIDEVKLKQKTGKPLVPNYKA